jgi:hypothetical protein
MGSLGNILLGIVALAIGIGMTYFSSTLIKIDQQLQIIIAIVVSVFAFIALYFMSKGRNG